MHFKESQKSFGINMRKRKKCNSFKKQPQRNQIFDPSEDGDFENSSKISSPNTSFYLKSSGNNSFYVNVEESKLKLIKMEPDTGEDELTLPNIKSKG